MHIAQNWRLNGQRYAMKGVRCESCQKVIFPPREICPHCNANLRGTTTTEHGAADVTILQRADR